MKRIRICAIASIIVLCTTVINAQNPIKRQKKSNNRTEQTNKRGAKQSKNKSSSKQSNAQSNTINVYTEKQFLDAIGSNRTIILQKSLNLTKIKDDDLKLTGYTHLSIKGVNPSICLVVSKEDNLVLWFESCKNVSISSLTMGHEDVQGCEDGVLFFSMCSGVTVYGCDIYGCGWDGITIDESDNITVTNCNIHNCTAQLLTIMNSSNIKIKDTEFKESVLDGMLFIHDSEQVIFENCSFFDSIEAGRENYLDKCFNLNCFISLKNCSIHRKDYLGDINYINQTGCRWY